MNSYRVPSKLSRSSTLRQWPKASTWSSSPSVVSFSIKYSGMKSKSNGSWGCGIIIFFYKPASAESEVQLCVVKGCSELYTFYMHILGGVVILVLGVEYTIMLLPRYDNH